MPSQNSCAFFSSLFGFQISLRRPAACQFLVEGHDFPLTAFQGPARFLGPQLFADWPQSYQLAIIFFCFDECGDFDDTNYMSSDDNGADNRSQNLHVLR